MPSLLWEDYCVNWLHSTLPTESISANKILLLTHFHSLYLSEWQLCFSCQDRLNRAPVNKHHGGKMEMSCPFQRPHRGRTIPTFSKFQIPGAFNVRAASYLDLAFCLRAAAGAGFEAGSGAGEGLTDSYRPRHLQQNTKKCKKRKKMFMFCWQENVVYKEDTHRFLIFFTKALADLTILLIRTCHQHNT